MSGGSLLVLDLSRNKTFTLAPGETSRLLLATVADRYALARPAEQSCRYAYPTIVRDSVPFPEGRHPFDGKLPKTLTLITIDDGLIARAYPYRKGEPIDLRSEFLRDGFPARPVRTCTGATS